MSDPEQRRLSLAEFIEQRDFALERCAVLRAELAARDERIAELTAEVAGLNERLAKHEPAR